jgi:hypothetical protein
MTALDKNLKSGEGNRDTSYDVSPGNYFSICQDYVVFHFTSKN